MNYKVTYEIEYEKDNEKIQKRQIANWDKLNTELKWIRSKFFDTIIIFRNVAFNDEARKQVVSHRFQITLTAYDSSPLKYQEFWDQVHELQIKAIKESISERWGNSTL